jgi:predicted nuclease of predicted toxin-antitoxin system
MRFIVDAQLPPALARWIEAKGHAAEHVGDIGMQSASDSTIWTYALANIAVIVSKDEDFAQRRTMAETGPAIVWLRLPNTRRHALIVWFDGILPDVVAALERGETLIEVT